MTIMTGEHASHVTHLTGMCFIVFVLHLAFNLEEETLQNFHHTYMYSIIQICSILESHVW